MRMATELTRQANLMHEMQLELQRLATTTSQAEQRAQVTEEKAMRCSHGHRHDQRCKSKRRPSSTTWLDAQRPTLQTVWTRRASRSSWKRPRRYLSVLAPGLLARPLLEWAAAFRDHPIVTE